MGEDVTKSLNPEAHEDFEDDQLQHRFHLMENDVLEGLGFDNLEDITRNNNSNHSFNSEEEESFFNSGFPPEIREDEQFCELVSRRYPDTRYRGTNDSRNPPNEEEIEEDDDDEEEDNGLISPLRRNKKIDNIFYAPDRAPPIVDFLTVVTAFFVAVLAAYYSISF